MWKVIAGDTCDDDRSISIVFLIVWQMMSLAGCLRGLMARHVQGHLTYDNDNLC